MSDEKKKKKSLLKRFFQLVQDISQWIVKTVGDDDTRRAMLMDLGLPPDLPPNTPPAKFPPHELPAITRYRAKEEPDHAAFLEAVQDLKSLYETGRAFVKAYQDSEGGANEALTEEITHRFFELMALNYIRTNIPGLYWLAQPLGLIEEKLTTFGPGETSLERITGFFKDIGGHFKQIGGGLDDDAQAEAWLDTLLSLATVASLFSDHVKDVLGETYYGWDADPKSLTPGLDKVASRSLSVSYDNYNASLALVPRTHGGPGLLLALGGALDFNVPLSDEKALQIVLNAAGAVDLFVRLDRFDAEPNASLPKLKFKLVNLPKDDAPSATTLLPETTDANLRWTIGNEKGTHLELGPLAFTVELSTEGIGASVAFADSALIIRDGDSFVVEALGTKDTRMPFHFGIGFKSGGNLFLEGGLDAGLKLAIPVSKSLGKARLQYLCIVLEPEISETKHTLTLTASAALDVKLGPVQASIDQIGFRLKLDFDAANKNLGFADLSIGFKPPNGIGLSVDSKLVKGGGFLFLDVSQGQYAGAMELQIKGKIALKALGLLNTRLPDGSEGFSLLIIVSAEKMNVPVGPGFKLTGVGGLIGINRTLNAKALQDGVRNKTLDAILFPKDPIRNAPQYISALRTVFPPARDSHLFAPMLQFTWGAGPIMTLNLALAIEFGLGDGFQLKKIAIMGQLLSVLPKPESELVRLRMDAVGIVDFEQETASLDAFLYDSRFAKTYVITGAMAMRLRWGKEPSFALAVGGFHPAFTPPADFPKLERVTLSLANSEDLKLTCESYFAITSNTVQFGARASLFAKKAGFSIAGEIGYDVLIHFDPFHFLAGFYASLQLKRGSTNLFKVRLEGELEGPRPLKVRGKATFEILWWDYSVSFDRTLISGEKPPLPAPVQVLPLLKQALNDPISWNAELPAGATSMVTLRDSARAGEIMAHPLGLLQIRQSVVPLKLQITRFGQTRPTETTPFSLPKVMLGGQVEGQPRDVEDFFAPAQFRDLSDDERLSSPSFEKFVAGLQVGKEQVTTGAALAAGLSYEEITLAPAAPAVKGTHQPATNLLSQFGHLSAAGLRAVRRHGQNKYQAQAIPFARLEKVYEIVSTQELAKPVQLPDATTSEYRTWAEANAAIWQARNNNRAEVRTVQIIERFKER
jgi:hypothetical protein